MGPLPFWDFVGYGTWPVMVWYIRSFKEMMRLLGLRTSNHRAELPLLDGICGVDIGNVGIMRYKGLPLWQS